ncbi:AMP-binding protein [Methylophaga sp.]|uniref:AMP-binding protein n=1 Tax=Methylophaga sp. TaxID=2024840 RepID=UPI0027225394|nr:AMP-binding protein [Methylophaga sp.]MDO8827447.1 AMP-binding protein [Methylophaga sp.]
MSSKILQFLEMLTTEHPDKICVGDGLQQLTRQQLMQQVESVAAELMEYQHQVVGLLADNSVQWLIMDLAAQRAGIILLPLPLFFTPDQLQHALQSAGAVGLIHDRPLTIDADVLAESHFVNSLMMSFTVCRGKSYITLPAGTAKITFTSGSTADPKGVCLSNDNQYQVSQSLLSVLQMQNVRHMALLPLSTLLENIAGLYTPLLSGGEVILLSMEETGFSGSLSGNLQPLLNTLSHYQPESLILVPELLSALLLAAEQGWQPPESLQFIAVGGSRVASELIERARQFGLPVYEGYGLSECSSVVSLNTPAQDKPGTAGKVLPHVDIQIEEGEIMVTGNAFLGYIGINSPQQNRVSTGDMGYLDQDGFLVIQGRKKQLLISSYGRNINPEWVESEVLAHPEILQCVLFGDAKPYCSALIYTRLSNAELENWLLKVNHKLPAYAQIIKWLRIEQPLTAKAGLLTANGRPRRNHIFALFQNELESIYQEPQYGIF